MRFTGKMRRVADYGRAPRWSQARDKRSHAGVRTAYRALFRPGMRSTICVVGRAFARRRDGRAPVWSQARDKRSHAGVRTAYRGPLSSRYALDHLCCWSRFRATEGWPSAKMESSDAMSGPTRGEGCLWRSLSSRPRWSQALEKTRVKALRRWLCRSSSWGNWRTIPKPCGSSAQIWKSSTSAKFCGSVSESTRSSGALSATRVRGGIDFVRKTEPPTIESSPTTVVPPSTVAFA